MAFFQDGVKRLEIRRRMMRRPRLIHYNDGHHFHAKRIEPPTSRHFLNWPVDEVLGTGVDLLILGLGYGDVYFHQSKVGRVVGEGKQVWESFIDWRIMRMVEAASDLGTDQLRAVIERGRETGLKVFPSLKLQDSAKLDSERCGMLKRARGSEVCIGDEGRAEWCYDFAHQAVQDDKLAMVGEVLEDYRADGLELDFCFDNFYFKAVDVEKNIPLMNEFVAKVRDLAAEIGTRQGRQISLMARVHLKEADNLASGLDVAAWFEAGSLDWVVGQDANVLVDPGIQAPWLAQVAGHGDGHDPDCTKERRPNTRCIRDEDVLIAFGQEGDVDGQWNEQGREHEEHSRPHKQALPIGDGMLQSVKLRRVASLIPKSG